MRRLWHRCVRRPRLAGPRPRANGPHCCRPRAASLWWRPVRLLPPWAASMVASTSPAAPINGAFGHSAQLVTGFHGLVGHGPSRELFVGCICLECREESYGFPACVSQLGWPFEHGVDCTCYVTGWNRHVSVTTTALRVTHRCAPDDIDGPRLPIRAAGSCSSLRRPISNATALTASSWWHSAGAWPGSPGARRIAHWGAPFARCPAIV